MGRGGVREPGPGRVWAGGGGRGWSGGGAGGGGWGKGGGGGGAAAGGGGGGGGGGRSAAKFASAGPCRSSSTARARARGVICSQAIAATVRWPAASHKADAGSASRAVVTRARDVLRLRGCGTIEWTRASS